MVAGPLAAWAARFSRPWAPISLLCGVAAAIAFLATLQWSVGVYVLAWWALCLCAGACAPLMDAGLVGAGKGLLAFGRSGAAIGGVAANIAIGVLFARLGAAGVMIWAGATGLLAVFAIPLLTPIPLLMPSVGAHPADPEGGWGEQAPQASRTDRTGLMLAVSAAALFAASHGFNAIAMITWTARGYGKDLCGVLWATGIAADIAFLWLLGRTRGRIPPVHLLALGGVGALVRWAGFATAPPLAVMFGLQALHALSFTATHLASIQLVKQLAEDRRNLSMQTKNWGLSTGLSAGVGALCAAPLYGLIGIRGYWVMCAVAAAGLVLALILRQHLRSRWPRDVAPHAPASFAGSSIAASAG